MAVPASVDIDALLTALRQAADEVATDPEVGPACLDAPEVYGVVASDADTFTARVGIRTNPADRPAVERALRAALMRRIQREATAARLGAADSDGRAPAAEPTEPGGDT